MIWTLIFLVGSTITTGRSAGESSDGVHPMVIDHYTTEKGCDDARLAIDRAMIKSRLAPFGDAQMLCVQNNPVVKG